MIAYVIVLGSCGAVLLFCCFMLWRNLRVLRYRSSLLSAIGKVDDAEIQAGDLSQWQARLAWFESVPYDAMLWRWWKPLDSFYPDKDEWLESAS